MSTANQLETMINSLSGSFIRWILPIFLLSAGGWAWNAESRLQKLEAMQTEMARHDVKIENLEKKVENLPVIEERISVIRDTLQEIRESLSH